MAITLTLKATKKQLEADPDKKFPLIFRYSYGEYNSAYFSTGKQIKGRHWSYETKKIKNSIGKGKTSLETFLNKIEGQIMKAVTDAQNDGDEPTPDVVRQRYDINKGAKARRKNPVLGEWRIAIAKKEKSGEYAERTIKNEKSSLASFEEFLEEHGRQNISFSAIDQEILDEYGEWLNDKYHNNTPALKKKQLKAFLRGNKKHLHDDEIVEAISYKEKPTTKIWLTKEELFMFQTFDFSRDKRLDRVRDLFVLQCHTGLRVSDLKRISSTHIKGDIIEIRAYKNSRDIRLPITPAIRGILEKYDYQLPIISDQRYNDFIKEVAEKVIPKTKIEVWQYKGGEKKKREPMKYEELSSHAAVRTFITLKAAAGMPVPSIAALTGKTVAVILKNYLGIDEAQVIEDAKKYDLTPMTVSRAK